MTLALAAMAQIFAMAAALYYIEQVAAEHHEDLTAQPADAAVAALEEKDQNRARSRAAITCWDAKSFGGLPKLLLVTGAICTMGSCYLVQVGMHAHA